MSTNAILPPLRSSRPAADIPSFFEAIEQALALYIKSEGTPDNTKPVLVHEFPKERLAKPDDVFDVITFKVALSEMAPTMNDGSKPRSPSLRESKLHPKLAGFNLDVFGWRELVQAEFIIWSKSSRNADAISDWFHKFMMKYAFIYKFFLARGVQNFRFVHRKDDDVDQVFGQEVYRRHLTYEFRLETLVGAEVKQLTDLDVKYGIYNQVDSIELKP